MKPKNVKDNPELNYRKVKNSETALEAYGELQSVWSSETILRTKTTILILRELEKMNGIFNLSLATPEFKRRAMKAIKALEKVRDF